jgi:hypothetical protein
MRGGIFVAVVDLAEIICHELATLDFTLLLCRMHIAQYCTWVYLVALSLYAKCIWYSLKGSFSQALTRDREVVLFCLWCREAH